MASSNLKLVIQKGPRSGETLAFDPKSTIRIGRVVRGNNLPIKDSGISSKHLEIKFNSDSLKWFATDLDSSNGTIVNTTQLRPNSQFEICNGDEIKIGELTSIKVEIVEIGEENGVRRNPRRRAVSKSVDDLKGKVEGGLNLGKNVEIREEIDSRRNPRGRAASKIDTDLKDEVEESSNLGGNEEVNNCRNPKKQAASTRGREVESKGEVLEESCSNMAEESSTVRELKEEHVVKGVEGYRRGRPPKKGSNNLGAEENVGNNKLKPEGGVGMRRTRSSRRGEVELMSLDEVMPARRTRSGKTIENATASSLMEKVVESKGSDRDDCIEVESKGVVENKKTRGGRGRKRKVAAESLEDFQETIAEEKTSHEALEKECPEKVVDLREQPCNEPVDDAPEKSLHDDMKEVVAPEQEGDGLSVREKHCAEMMDETHHVSSERVETVPGVDAEEKKNHEVLQDEISETVVDLREKPCLESVDDLPEQSVCDGLVNDPSEHRISDEPRYNQQEQSALDETKIAQLIEVEALEKECSEKVVDLPCDEPVDDAPEKRLHDDMKEVVAPEQERDTLSVREEHCAEMIDETHHVSSERVETVLGIDAEEKKNHEVLQDDISETVVDLREKPCLDSVDDLPEQSVCDGPVNDPPEESIPDEPIYNQEEHSALDETKIVQLIEVEVPEQEGGALSEREKNPTELADETNQQDTCVPLPPNEQHCAALMDKTNQEDNCNFLSTSEKHGVELMDEPTQHNDCDVGPSHVEGDCDRVGSDAVSDYERTGNFEIEEINKESEAECSGRSIGPENADVVDLEKMTLGDWFSFLETSLPKQIKAATDEIVEDMRKRSAQLEEYVLQHQNEKSKLPLATEKDELN